MNNNIYHPAFVGQLFNEMSRTYGTVNFISSFGFTLRWRQQCINAIALQQGARVFDLMTGQGELCPAIARRIGPTGTIHAIDLSAQMCRRAAQLAQSCPCSVMVVEADALENSLATESADAVVASFGLKTFSPAQQQRLAQQIARLLRPGGVFSLVEVAVPQRGLLRWPFMFYLKHVVPLIGRLLLGNPENYRMLGVYTEHFGDGRHFVRACRDAGLIVEERPLFFGCALCVVGYRPALV